jgi:glycosyltransferase involved in cell wall biosynthesis
MSARKLNVLIIGSSQGVFGGIEAFMMSLAKAADLWSEFNIKLCFKLVKGFTVDEKLVSMAEKSCNSFHLVGRGSKELLELIKWADIIHAQNMPPDIVIPAYLRGKKIILTVHNRRLDNNNLHNLIWGFTIKLADKRWFNSKFVWSTWESGRKSENSACVPTVCDLPTKEIPSEARRGFLFVGRWIVNKGIEEIIQAYELCNLDRKKWPLTILGDGPIRDKVHNLVRESKLDINLPGFVDSNIKQEIIASAKWLLAPANTLEDLGLTPIEARSVGVPSIVTNDGGLPEAGGPSALISMPGNVDDLARCMQQAVEMTELEYNQRSIIGKEELKTFLKPMNFYKEQYLQ